MKKTLALMCALFLVISALSSCSGEKIAKDKKIVCTMFPQYDWVMEILGEKAEEWDVSILMQTGTDLHSFEPTAEDIIIIDQSDLFIHVGGESDGWVDDVLSQVEYDKTVINMLEVLGDEAILSEHEHEHEHEHDHEDEAAEGEEHEHNDEHVWLSLHNAELLCDVICDSVCAIDKDNADFYRSNYQNYANKIDELDHEYHETVENSKHTKLLFADRFPFVYMCENYGIEYYAAFSGCSTESRADSETINGLITKLDEWELGCVCVLEGSDQEIAKTVISGSHNKDRDIIVFNSLQSVTVVDIEKGADYLELMQYNLDALNQALNM
ncbi:MAG: zinc ABC transporter substrate-binding protein [Clostridia bacterium]|nr:zinc ABC transporter substrate-binding protein [Clostridia bacterium]